MGAAVFNIISLICLILGFVSIFISVGVWFVKKGNAPEEKANAERFGIFIGLWVPALFALAIYFRLLFTG